MILDTVSVNISKWKILPTPYNTVSRGNILASGSMLVIEVDGLSLNFLN